ncbi:unnamed protein product [Chironomus riparius]|uniref:HTH CENPB-type domain-containing protein n=1 Tax=Chironomus riparius TaxID=315576 RepID=A0A9N9WUT2_9DIPT|nr:unnamed protein product [Chironomus riparius]
MNNCSYDKEDFDVMLNGKSYVLKLIDTAGQEDYERVRRLFYKDAKAFILCYSIENHASFNNIYNKWMPELKQIENWPIPFILVGTKIDLRDDPTYSKPLVTTEEGQGLAQRICANRFIECSAKKNVHIKDTIEEALRAVFNGPIVDEKKKKDSSSISRKYKHKYTTIVNICKRDKQKLESTTEQNDRGLNASTKLRPDIMIKLESMLFIWIEDCNQKGLPLSMENISIKSKDIYKSLKEKLDPQDKHCFNSSRGWFDKFKKRYQLHNLVLNGEAASADKTQADSFVETFLSKIDGNYSLDQIFNVDETGLFWKRMPSRTYIAQQSKSAAGHKVSKERLTLLLGANASGEFKLKPLLIYTSENPRAFKNVDKSKLGVYWRSNKKAWMTSVIFTNWVKTCLVKELKNYSLKKGMPFKFLILIDNAPGHANIEILNQISDGIKFMFLPPNTTSLIQPMDQGCISTFKSYYLKKSYQSILDSDCDEATVKDLWKKFNIAHAVKYITSAWTDVSENCVRGSWKKLIPSLNVVDENYMENVLLSIETHALNAGLTGMEQSDLLEILNDNFEYSVEDLQEILENDSLECSSETESEDESKKVEVLSKKDLKEIVNIFSQLKLKIKECDPDKERVFAVENDLSKAENYYLKQVKTQKVQKPIDLFF